MVNDLPPRERNIAMVFQNYALYPHMNVRDNIGFGLKIARPSPRPRSNAWIEAAAILELERPAGPHARRSCPAASASASPWAAPSCAHPEVFLFDEPLSNLDAKLRVQMRAEIERLHQRVRAHDRSTSPMTRSRR